MNDSATGAAAAGRAGVLSLLGVEYLHLPTPDGGDLYLTVHGRPFADHLHPEAWFAPEWFHDNRQRLPGTGTVYRVRTRTRRGRAKDLVVKWCRVGEAIPCDTFTFTKFVEAEFNSPYEEFALVMELRADPHPPRIRTHKPLAIHVPARRHEPWQLGRSLSRMGRKMARDRDVELDICRQYILIYEWVDGCSIVEAADRGWIGGDDPAAVIRSQADRAQRELAAKGFRVLDFKPEHLIVRPRPDGTLLRGRNGDIAYALVDFELLERTPEHEREVAGARRAAYLRHQKVRFEPVPAGAWPLHLRPSRIASVDYVFGHCESTGGDLWVVGRDPALFDYFLPERWRRTPRRRLSQRTESWWTRTKDLIQLVWKVSRVGEWPEGDAAARHGYNSPFEEFAIALELAGRGVPTTYPRAIYRTGQEVEGTSEPLDRRRFLAMTDERDPDGRPALTPDRSYIAVWGYWNGTDEMLAEQDVERCVPVSLADALSRGWISAAQHDAWLAMALDQLRAAGWEDLKPEGGHVLLSRAPDGSFWHDAGGSPLLRWCNFSLLRRL